MRSYSWALSGHPADAEPVHDSGRTESRHIGVGTPPSSKPIGSVYPSCASGPVVADVVRIDKGHTEGLEPAVPADLVRLMTSAAGGKIQRAGA